MPDPITFRPTDELEAAISQEIARFEDEHDIDIEPSKIVRKRLRKAYNLTSGENGCSGSGPEQGAA